MVYGKILWCMERFRFYDYCNVSCGEYEMRWMENRFNGGVKKFNLTSLIFGLDESMGEIRDFDLHLVTI